MTPLIGTDAEIMLVKAGTTDFVSAIPVLPKAVDLPYGKIFFDNVLAEFTVTPSATSEEFVDRITTNLREASNLFKSKGLDIHFASSAHYSRRELQNPKAREFGCSPDYNAYSLTMNVVSMEAARTTLRSAGAHVHFSHPIFEDILKIPQMIQLMDVFLGVPSLFIDNTPQARERRLLYGKAGAHRPCDYPGGEYRVLSNFWIKEDKLIDWVFMQTRKCLDMVVDGMTSDSIGFSPFEIERIINESDMESANAVLNRIHEINTVPIPL